jgi:hypothetical protein
VWLDGGLDMSFAPDGQVQLALYPAVRAFFTRPEARWGGFAFRLGAGLDLGFGAGGGVTPRPVVLPAFGFDFRAYDDLRVRLDLGYTTRFDGPGALAVQVGVVFSPKKRPEPVVEAPEPFVESGLVWLDAPVCDWSDRDEARAFLAEQEGGTLPVEEAGQTEAGSGDAPVAQGSLVIVGWPGDTVVVGYEDFDGETTAERTIDRMDADGVHVLSINEGIVTVTVTGGGRTASFPGALSVSAGHATWARLPEPASQRAHFAIGSSTVLPEDVDPIRALAASPGNGWFQLFGSYSPEGRVSDNLRLATARAEAVRDLLIEAGMPADRIVVETREFPDPDEPPEEQRSVDILPIPGPPEEAP